MILSTVDVPKKKASDWDNLKPDIILERHIIALIRNNNVSELKRLSKVLNSNFYLIPFTQKNKLKKMIDTKINSKVTI